MERMEMANNSLRLHLLFQCQYSEHTIMCRIVKTGIQSILVNLLRGQISLCLLNL